MGFADSGKQAGMGMAAAALTAALIWFGTGLHPHWLLTWFAPLPVLVFALRSRWWVAALTAAAAWFAGSLNLWGYFHLLGMPPAVFWRILAEIVVAAALAVLLFRALVVLGALWSGLIAFPALLVTLEFVRNLTSVHGTGGSLAYSQLTFLPFLQLASLTGPWGMTFLLLLFPAALAIGIHLQKQSPRQAMRVVGTTLAVIAAVLVFGAIRLATSSSSRQVMVGLIASDANMRVAENGAATDRLFENYAAVAEKLAARGAQAIVLPEKVGVVLDAENGSADPIFQRLADRTAATIVVGEVHVSGAAKYNQARVYQPHAPVLSYDKEHMLPPFESNLTPGTALVTLRKPAETWGVAICKDMDFTLLSRRYGSEDVGLMLVPGWDFYVDRVWHGHMAVMRGVEDGFSIARAAKGGSMTVSDSRGRMLAETRSNAAPFATLLVSVPAAHSRTLYLLLGDWFGWVACALLLFAVLQLCRMAVRGEK